MIFKYKEFIKENNNLGITLEEKELLDKYEIKNFKKKDNGSFDVFQDIDFFNKRIIEIPLKFNKVEGDFICSNNDLKTLKNSPNKVTGNFYCHRNKLTSLEHCPTEVYGDFIAERNVLKSLEYCPEKINGDFDCSENQLTSLEGCPKYVGGDFKCFKNYINIEDYPLCIIQGNYRSGESLFPAYAIVAIVKENEEIFKNLLDDKIKFHQMVMRLEPGLIKYYKTIQPPKNNTKLLV